LPGTNTLAYLASSSAMNKKSFISLTPDSTKVEILALNSWIKGLNLAMWKSKWQTVKGAKFPVILTEN
jgi:hypothetical protein